MKVSEILALADSLVDAGQLDAAIDAYQAALRLQSPFPEARHNLAAALVQAGRFDEAIEACQAAIAERPAYALAFNTLGVALSKRGSYEEARCALEDSIRLRPDYAKAHHNLASVLDQMGRTAEAVSAYREALRLRPDLAEAHYDLAALGAVTAPPCMPRSYVVQLFDEYAGGFDEHLVKALNYQVPEMLLDAVTATRPKPGLEMVDLGSGTGLAGRLFRPLASRLVGVDLSPGMLREAGRRNVYDELIEDDIVHYLESRKGDCDLLLAADVLIYIGDVQPLFRAVAGALRPDGLFAFSIELVTAVEYVLRPTRRYAQSMEYIERLAHENGLGLVSATSAPLRVQDGQGVDGMIVVVRRASLQESHV